MGHRGHAEFADWYGALEVDEQASLDESIDTIRQSSFSKMKELCTQIAGRPLRTFFAFDPRRSAILLIGGDKTGDDRFYERMVPIADRLYATHLEELKAEDLI